MRLTESQLKFLARFAKSPEGREFIELLRTKVGEVDARLRTASGDEMYRTQGKAIALDDLLAEITEASDRLTASKSAAVRPRKFAFTDGPAYEHPHNPIPGGN